MNKILGTLEMKVKELDSGEFEVIASEEVFDAIVRYAKKQPRFPKYRGRRARQKTISWAVNQMLREMIDRHKKK